MITNTNIAIELSLFIKGECQVNLTIDEALALYNQLDSIFRSTGGHNSPSCHCQGADGDQTLPWLSKGSTGDNV